MKPVGYSKEGKTPPPPAPAPSGFPLELSLIAGQFIFFNNNADSSLSFNKTDAYMFETQLLGRLKLFGGAVTITEGPTVQIWNEAGLGPTGPFQTGNRTQQPLAVANRLPFVSIGGAPILVGNPWLYIY